MKRTISTMNCSKGDVILLPYPFTDLKTIKVRPAVVVCSDQGKYEDLFVVPITSKTGDLGMGEFILSDWQMSGLNVISAIKRGCVLVDSALFRKKVGTLSHRDLLKLNESLRAWLEL